jgi:dienelactone hydrolase
VTTPLLLVRAGQDHARINDTIDRFVSAALAANAPLELVNAPSLHHGFDVNPADDTEVTGHIIERSLAFFETWLLPQVN